VVFDLDSTGMDPLSVRITRLSLLKILPDGTSEAKSRYLSAKEKQTGSSPEHSRQEGVDHPSFKQIAKALLAYLTDCDLCSFNGKHFDLPLLTAEYTSLGIPFPAPDVCHVDVFDIYQMLHPQVTPKALGEAVTHYLGGERNSNQSHANPAIIFNILQAMITGPLTYYMEEAEPGFELFSPKGLSAFGDKLHQKRLKFSPQKVTQKPLSMRLFQAENQSPKVVDELIGICRGILADGEVNENEAVFFAEWARKNAPTDPIWPFTDILERVERIFEDGVCDAQEREELRGVMTQLCGFTHSAAPTTAPSFFSR
jgi:hypothetical protein